MMKTKHKLYPTYRSMISRCFNSNHRSFHRYGGRGITICQRWLDDFEAFAEDMGDRPEGHQLDRINNDGPYSPENCRWSPRTMQQTNRSGCRHIVATRGGYDVRIVLRPHTKQHTRWFKTLEQAEDYLADCLMEREMFNRMGGRTG